MIVNLFWGGTANFWSYRTISVRNFKGILFLNYLPKKASWTACGHHPKSHLSIGKKPYKTFWTSVWLMKSSAAVRYCWVSSTTRFWTNPCIISRESWRLQKSTFRLCGSWLPTHNNSKTMASPTSAISREDRQKQKKHRLNIYFRECVWNNRKSSVLRTILKRWRELWPRDTKYNRKCLFTRNKANPSWTNSKRISIDCWQSLPKRTRHSTTIVH